MKRMAATIAATLLTLGLCSSFVACGDTPVAGGESGWTENYKAALETAKKDHKLVLLDFTGSDWCPPCKALTKDVFGSDAFKAWAKDKVVLVTLDYPEDKPQDDATKKQNAELAKQYKIEGYPTVVILNSEGKEIARDLGYDATTPEKWTAKKDEQIKGAK